MFPDGPRQLSDKEFSTEQYLENAARQAHKRNYKDFLIVDVDSHHYESEVYNEVFEYIESPVIRRAAFRVFKPRRTIINDERGASRLSRHWRAYHAA